MNQDRINELSARIESMEMQLTELKKEFSQFVLESAHEQVQKQIDESPSLVETVEKPVTAEPPVAAVKPVVAEQPVVAEPVQPAAPQTPVRPKAPQKPADSQQSLESKLGKRIVPIAASALIFIALVLFGRLIQPHLTDAIKAILMFVFSIGVSVLGVIKMNKESKPGFFHALAACGVTACYVSAIVSHFTLNVISDITLMIIIGLWIATLIWLSRAKAKIFAYICYVGILIATFLCAARWGEGMPALVTYVVSIGALFAANFSKDYRQVSWYFLQYPIILFIICCMPDLSAFVYLALNFTVFIAQLWYYGRQQDVNWKLFEIPVLLYEVFPLIVAYPALFANHWSFPYAVILLLIASSVLLYHIAYGKGGNRLFYFAAGITVILGPWLDYGATYQLYVGHCIVPAVLLLACGQYIRNHYIRNVGYGYLALSALFLPAKAWSLMVPNLLPLSGQSDAQMHFNYILLIDFLVVIALWFIQQWQKDLKDLKILIGCFLFFLAMAYSYGYISLFYASLVVIALALYLEQKNILYVGYLILNVSVLNQYDRLLNTSQLAWLEYIIVIGLILFRGYRLFVRYDKLEKFILVATLICLLFRMTLDGVVGNIELWILIGLLSLALNLCKFSQNFVTHEPEKDTRDIVSILGVIVMALGYMFIYAGSRPMFLLRNEIPHSANVLTFIVILLSLALSLLNTKNLFSPNGLIAKPALGVFEGFKYTLLLVTLLHRFGTLSYVDSLIGILLATGFIIIGFRQNLKTLRLYGLVLSMLCVIKLLFFDIVFDNAYYRPVSFLLAGILLFLISYIYFRFEKKQKGEE